MKLELIDAGGFATGRVPVGAGGNETTVMVRVDRNVKRQAKRVLRFRATGKLASGATVVTLTEVSVKSSKGRTRTCFPSVITAPGRVKG